MKKIMFTDDLTRVVLEGRKTMTRRIAFSEEISKPESGFLTEGDHAGKLVLCDGGLIVAKSAYKVGEDVAVAQRYSDIPMETLMKQRADGKTGRWPFESLVKRSKGFRNKMYVAADLMPYRIKITNIRVERLQEITNADCILEGIGKNSDIMNYSNPREAFADLIDKISGRGTWEKNPWVWVYEFELVK